MALAKRNEGAKVSSDINVTPMVDVMLVLLIIFMVVTPMLQKGISVDMAKVNNPEQMPDADKEDALLVSITRDGKVYFGSDQIQDVDNLTTKVKDRLANKAGQARVREGGHADPFWRRRESRGQRACRRRGRSRLAHRSEEDHPRPTAPAAPGEQGSE